MAIYYLCPKRTEELRERLLSFRIQTLHIECISKDRYMITSPQLNDAVYVAAIGGNLMDNLNFKIQVRASLKASLRAHGRALDYNDMEKRYILNEYKAGAKNRFICSRYSLSRVSLLRWAGEL